jgi:hypothetical protein
MLQYKVPQNVEVEDKIIGPLTAKQFIQAIIGCMVLYLLYALLPFSLFVIAGIPVALFFAALALYKVNDQPFEKFLISLINYIIRPNQRVWKKEIKMPDIKVVKTKKEEKEKPPEKKEVTRSRLDELAYILDTRGWVEERGERRESTEMGIFQAPEVTKEAPKVEAPPKEEKETKIEQVPKEKIKISSPFEDLLTEEPEDIYEYYSNKM